MSGEVKRQWDGAAKSFTVFVRSDKNYYSKYLNGPALKRMVGEVKGKRVLDIGCGEGLYSRFFAGAGAEVTGVDISEAMIKEASDEEERHPLGIRYNAADAADLSMLGSEAFDVAFSHMSLMDIEDYEGAISEASRVLKKGGRFVAVMEHPCFSTRNLGGRMIGGWETRIREDGSKEYLYYRVEDYLRAQRYTSQWRHDRLPSSFVTTGFHRPLSEYVNAMVRSGLFVTRMEEPQPMEEGVRAWPSMGKHYRVPQSIVIEATKFNGL